MSENIRVGEASGLADNHLKVRYIQVSEGMPYKNSSGDEVANVLVNDDIAHT